MQQKLKLKGRTFTKIRLPFNAKSNDCLHCVRKPCVDANTGKTIRSITINLSRGNLVRIYIMHAHECLQMVEGKQDFRPFAISAV